MSENQHHHIEIDTAAHKVKPRCRGYRTITHADEEVYMSINEHSAMIGMGETTIILSTTIVRELVEHARREGFVKL